MSAGVTGRRPNGLTNEEYIDLLSATRFPLDGTNLSNGRRIEMQRSERDIDTIPSNELTTFSIILVNHNGGAFIQKALNSLGAQTRRDFEVILIDNASHDGSIDDLKTTGIPSFTLLTEKKNHGYAKATNIAACLATGTWLVCFNPDAEANPDWLERIAEAQHRHPKSKMFASAQLNLIDPSVMDGVGDAYLIFGLPWRGGFGRPLEELPHEGLCFSPCGAGAVYHKQTFLELGGLDESFFCFCEDVDIGFRMQLSGYDCVFMPEAVIHHVGGGVSGKTSSFTIYHGTRNRIWTYVKNMPAVFLFLTLPGHLALTGYLLLRSAMCGRFSATWLGVLDGFRDARNKRNEGKTHRRKLRSPLRLAQVMAWNPWRMSQHRTHVRKLRSTEVD